jgi:peptide chain release factor 3
VRAHLLREVGADLDRGAYLAGEATPVFFGSALLNFGVRLLLEALAELAPPPGPRRGAEGGERSLDDPFSGLVFKLQANLDPEHRDRLAFVRVCSGRFERGMRAVNARTGKPLRMAYAHELFGQQRATLEREFGASVGLEPAGWTVSRRIDLADADLVARAPAREVLADAHGHVLAAFKDRFALERFERSHPEVALDPFMVR